MATIFGGVGGALTFSSASGGKVYAFNAITNVSNTNLAPANPARQKILFHNPRTVDIFISPTLVQTTGSSAAFTPTISSYGGCFRVFANGGALEISGECQGAWQALAASGTANPLTVMDSNT